jgi:predicted Holliday junction resolvase-like endonuclease
METLLIALVVFLVVALVLAVVLRPPRESYTEEHMQHLLSEDRAKTRQITLRQSSATLKGQIGERFAPFVPGFGYEPADARFLGSPIDYVVFDGLTDGHVRSVVFVEVKVGSLPLTPFQKQVMQAVERKDVKWRVVKLPDRDV